MNDFKKDLAFSHAAEDLPFWKEVYKRAFPGYQACVSNRADGQLQRGGVDRTIVLNSGKSIYVDEKIRRLKYTDVLLEYISNDKKNTPGWVCKPLLCHYIAYGWLEYDCCILLPVEPLQAAWLNNKDKWMNGKNGCKKISARNNTYNTLSLAVPVNTLMNAIKESLLIKW